MTTYVEIDGVNVEVPESADFNEHIIKIANIIRGIKKEQIFVFNGVQIAFRLDRIESQYGKIFVRFHVIAFADIAKELIGAPYIFEAELLLSKIRMRCYYTKIEPEYVDRKSVKVSLLGEVIF